MRCPEMGLIHRRASGPRLLQKATAPAQLDLRLSRPAKLTARDVVQRHLLGVLPPGVPPSFSRIDSAEFQGSGRGRTAVAALIMVDGLPATVEVFAWGAGCSGHRWLKWEGDALFFEDGRWQRDADQAKAA